MDVQAAAPTATILPPAVVQSASTQPAPSSAPPSTGASIGVIPVPVAAVSEKEGASSSSTDSGGTGGSTIGATPGLATLPAGPPDGTKKGQADTTLASAVALLYNVQEQNVAVSFQIEQNPNEIVMVFTNKQTGKVIVQFPSETMIALAKLFDKLDGSVVNKKV
jgi:hypothetical protein